MTTRKNSKTEIKTLREVANAFSQKEVDACVAAIEASFARRDLFEGSTAAIGNSSYSVNRDKVLNNKIAVARFFLALGVSPSAVIERKVSSNKMFNAKALKKIVELAQFVVLDSRKIEKVMSAFILCAVKFSEANSDEAIANRYNKSFLSNLDFSAIVEDSALADYLADYQHSFISGGKDTQSSQARCVLEVLNLATITNDESRFRGAIQIKRDHAFYDLFVTAFCK